MKTKYKGIFKKSLMVYLVRLGNDLSHTERNQLNPKHQIYYFPLTEKLLIDLAWLTQHEYDENKYNANE